MPKIQTTAICVCHLEANYKNVNICNHRNSCKIYWKDIVSIYTCLSKLVQIKQMSYSMGNMNKWLNINNKSIPKLKICNFINDHSQ
jgi:hypothetical protein